MFRKTFMALCATCVFLMPLFASASGSDIVLYATDSSNAHGNWARASDPTAAGGQTLTSADKGWSNTGGPLASPPDYVDFTFTAPSATPYHMWMRMRATA